MLEASGEETLCQTFDWTNDESVALSVIRTVTEATDEDPLEMEPLYLIVDPDALDALCKSTRRSPDGAGTIVEFSFNGFRVRISATGMGYLFEES